MLTLPEALAHVRSAGVKYYVYVVRRPTGEPFYVGKGSGDRIVEHERARQEDARLRVVALAKAMGATIQMPNHRSGVSAWIDMETRLMAAAAL